MFGSRDLGKDIQRKFEPRMTTSEKIITAFNSKTSKVPVQQKVPTYDANRIAIAEQAKAGAFSHHVESSKMPDTQPNIANLVDTANGGVFGTKTKTPPVKQPPNPDPKMDAARQSLLNTATGGAFSKPPIVDPSAKTPPVNQTGLLGMPPLVQQQLKDRDKTCGNLVGKALYSTCRGGSSPTDTDSKFTGVGIIPYVVIGGGLFIAVMVLL